MTPNTKPPPVAGGGSDLESALAGELEATNRAPAVKRQAALAAEPVTLDEVNAKRAAARWAVERAAEWVDDAISAIDTANDIAEVWSRQHPGRWIEEIDQIDQIVAPDIDEIAEEDEEEEDGDLDDDGGSP
jgi:hypothetical protein